jgi:hypothetical protein
MRRKERRDRVTRELREAVLERDEWRCVAPVIDPKAGECRSAFGDPMAYGGGYRVAHLELDHVKDQPRMSVRAESDAAHLVTLCPWHHRESGWATGRRGMLRDYLRRKANPISSPELGSPTEAPEPVQLAFPKKVSHL